MAEYIEREALKRSIFNGVWYDNQDEDVAYDLVDKAPAADVVEVRHGEWVHTDMALFWHSKDECSECHYHDPQYIDLSYHNYCPNCGAKMDGKGEGE